MNSMTESAIRSRAKVRGLKLEKSRSRCKEWPGYGTFRVIDPALNKVVHAGNYDTFGASLEGCAKFIESHKGIMAVFGEVHRAHGGRYWRRSGSFSKTPLTCDTDNDPVGHA